MSGSTQTVTSVTRRRVFLALWITAAVLLVVRTGSRDRAITDHLKFGRRLFAQEELYAPYLDDQPLHPVYPPSFGLMTAPFTLVPDRVARYAWGLLQVAALWGIGAFLVDWLRRSRPELVGKADWLLLAVAVLASRYVLRDTHGGGGNLINLALALVALRAAQADRSWWAAVLLGFSLATKPTMALLVPVFFLLGFRRAAIGAVVASAACVGLALLVNGRGIEPFAHWFEGATAYAGQTDVFAPPHLELPPFTWMNQCLRCAAARYLGETPVQYAELVPGYVQGLGWPVAVVAWIARLANATILLSVLWVAWRARRDFDGRALAVSVALAGSLLTSPISWKAHHVALVPAMFAVVVAASVGNRRALWIGVAYFVLCVAGGGDLVGDAVKEWQQSLYLATAGTLVIAGWLVGQRTNRV